METLKRLTFVTRGEQKLYCFIEACNTIFPNVSRSTVRLWLTQFDPPILISDVYDGKIEY
jgi:hypothetical protein